MFVLINILLNMITYYCSFLLKSNIQFQEKKWLILLWLDFKGLALPFKQVISFFPDLFKISVLAKINILCLMLVKRDGLYANGFSNYENLSHFFIQICLVLSEAWCTKWSQKQASWPYAKDTIVYVSRFITARSFGTVAEQSNTKACGILETLLLVLNKRNVRAIDSGSRWKCWK